MSKDSADNEKKENNNDSRDSSEKKGDDFVKSLREALPSASLPAQLSSRDLNGVAKFIQDGKSQNIIVMIGAGVSTSAGIPDFRSPGSGLYDNLQKYNLPHPMAVFEINYFHKNPKPFYSLAKELYPGRFKPTPSHYFLRLLHEKNLLLRVYTQNVDTLEHIAGIPPSRIIEAHGSFQTSHCTKCKEEYTKEWMKEKIFADDIPKCTKCSALIKPDIIFFGESLPDRYFSHTTKDFPRCDLLIIMGTSLVVQPFAGLVDRVGKHVPRLLINDRRVEYYSFHESQLSSPNNKRDVFHQAKCDEACEKFAELLGYKDELEQLISRESARIDASTKCEEAATAAAASATKEESKI